MRRTRRSMSWFFLAACAALAACTAPAPAPDGGAAPAATPSAVTAPANPGTGADDGGVPPRRGQATTDPAAGGAVAPPPPREVHTPAAAVRLDYSCRVDADCAVKNVGNCCGAMPACVNKDSPTDPAAVQAECARNGVSSVCGFAEIASCSCVASRCEAQSTSAPVTR